MSLPVPGSQRGPHITQLLEAAGSLDPLIEAAAASADATDAKGRFPERSINAFRSSGLTGLISATAAGGLGGSLRDAVDVVERLGSVCGSTAMIVAMHYSGVAVIEAVGTDEQRGQVASGAALATLAFSEAGSRSHFWAPLSIARRDGDAIVLDACKTWVTAAAHADFYVWSSQATRGAGSSIWLVPRETAGLDSSKPFDGMGLRGNESAPITASGARIPGTNLLGEDGKGADVMLGKVLPVFCVLNASASAGLMKGAVERTIAHVRGTRLEHLDQSLSELPTIRAYVARMQLKADMVSSLIGDTLDALEQSSDATILRVLEVKAAASEMATEVTELAMRVCGGAAFRREVGVERYFRDARAATVMAPTTDQLYEFIGRALCGMDLFG